MSKSTKGFGSPFSYYTFVFRQRVSMALEKVQATTIVSPTVVTASKRSIF
jgi:hypothetical protein